MDFLLLTACIPPQNKKTIIAPSAAASRAIFQAIQHDEIESEEDSVQNSDGLVEHANRSDEIDVSEDDEEDVSDCHSDGIDDEDSDGNHECTCGSESCETDPEDSHRNSHKKQNPDAQVQIQAVSSTQQSPSSSVECHSSTDNGNDNADRRNVNGDQLA